jgi:hypothetical protein
MPLTQIEAASDPVLEVELLKTQCSLTGSSEFDTFLLSQVLPAAVDRCQLATRRQLLEETWEWQLDAFPCERFLELPKAPLIAVDSVKYTDLAGARGRSTRATMWCRPSPGRAPGADGSG